MFIFSLAKIQQELDKTNNLADLIVIIIHIVRNCAYFMRENHNSIHPGYRNKEIIHFKSNTLYTRTRD